MKALELLRKTVGLTNQQLEELPDLYLEEIHNHFYEWMSVEHSESGATSEYEYDFDHYTQDYSLRDMLTYIEKYAAW